MERCRWTCLPTTQLLRGTGRRATRALTRSITKPYCSSPSSGQACAFAPKAHKFCGYSLWAQASLLYSTSIAYVGPVTTHRMRMSRCVHSDTTE